MTAAQMLTHLRNRWGVVDFVDIMALMSERGGKSNETVSEGKHYLRLAGHDEQGTQILQRHWRLQARHPRIGSTTCSNSDMGQSEDFDVH
jgi:hypothetical protein